VTIAFDEHGLSLDGRPVPWLSGDIHYWRHSPKDWPALLERITALGLRMICTYIPWGVHEGAPGAFDFGDLDPAKGLDRFLDLAGQYGLHVLVRPGPHINAELTYFGFPARLFDNPAMLARNARGGPVLLPMFPRMFPLPSYASEAFWSEVEVWFDALAPILKPRLYPRGPIVGVQLDNECSYFFRTSAYDQDYHPDARAKWLDFLRAKYGDLPAASLAHGGPPPGDRLLPDEFLARRPAETPFYLDWVEFKEHLLGDALARCRRLWEERGIADVVFFHNFPPSEGRTPLNVPRAEHTAHFCGLDFYMHKHEYASLRRRLLALTGQSRCPISPEFGSGVWHLWPPIDLADQEFTTRVAWMFGLRGANFYMIVDRDRWYGAPITRTGGVRRDAWNFYEKHFALLRRLEPWRLRRRAPICLLSPRDYERLEAAATVVAPLSPMIFEAAVPPEDLCVESSIGFAKPIQRLYAKILRGWESALTQMGIPYTIGSTDLADGALARYQAVVCPTFEFLGRHAQELLTSYAEAGGCVICGPEAPALDEAMREFSGLDRYAGRPVERLEGAVDIVLCEAGRGRLILVTEPPANFGDAGRLADWKAGRLEGSDSRQAPARSASQPPSLSALPRSGTVPQNSIVETICRRLGVEPVYPASPPCETSLLEELGPPPSPDRRPGQAWRLPANAGGRRVLFVANPTAAPQRPRIATPTPAERFVDLETGDCFFGDGAIQVDLPPYSVRILDVLG